MLFFAVTKPKKKILLVAKIAFLCVLLGVIVPGIYYCLTNAGAMESFMQSFKNDSNQINQEDDALVIANPEEVLPSAVKEGVVSVAEELPQNATLGLTQSQPEKSLQEELQQLKTDISAKVSGFITTAKIQEEQLPGEPIRVIKNEPEQGVAEEAKPKAVDTAQPDAKEEQPSAEKINQENQANKEVDSKDQTSKKADEAASNPPKEGSLWQKLTSLIFGEKPEVQLYQTTN